MKTTLKKITPAALWKLGSDGYWWWQNRGQHTVGRSLNAQWQENQRRLEAYRARHAGQRCFILGNGPSLKKTDLTRLRGEVTFGLNRIYLLFPELGFPTTYLVSVNELVLEQTAAEMMTLTLPRFLTWRARRWFEHKPAQDPNLMFLDSDFTGDENFTGEATGRMFEGFTVTYVALQLAFYMGFTEAILIGVDHNFTTQGPANTTVVSQGDDPNHFAPGYFGKGFRWQLPDLAGSERAYRMAQAAYAQAERRVVDATVGGKLNIFPKVDYLSLFEK